MTKYTKADIESFYSEYLSKSQTFREVFDSLQDDIVFTDLDNYVKEVDKSNKTFPVVIIEFNKINKTPESASYIALRCIYEQSVIKWKSSNIPELPGLLIDKINMESGKTHKIVEDEFRESGISLKSQLIFGSALLNRDDFEERRKFLKDILDDSILLF